MSIKSKLLLYFVCSRQGFGICLCGKWSSKGVQSISRELNTYPTTMTTILCVGLSSSRSR